MAAAGAGRWPTLKPESREQQIKLPSCPLCTCKSLQTFLAMTLRTFCRPLPVPGSSRRLQESLVRCMPVFEPSLARMDPSVAVLLGVVARLNEVQVCVLSAQPWWQTHQTRISLRRRVPALGESARYSLHFFNSCARASRGGLGCTLPSHPMSPLPSISIASKANFAAGNRRPCRSWDHKLLHERGPRLFDPKLAAHFGEASLEHLARLLYARHSDRAF